MLHSHGDDLNVMACPDTGACSIVTAETVPNLESFQINSLLPAQQTGAHQHDAGG
jgi:hypothetical protein